MQRLTPTERAEKLLGIIPYVLSNQGCALDEVSERFGYPQDILLADVNSVLPYLAPYPFTPDVAMGAVVHEGQINIANAEFFSHPPMLSLDHAFELFVAGSAVLEMQELPAESPLSAAVRKLTPDASVSTGLDVGDRVAPDLLENLEKAITERRRVQIDYYSQGRAERNLRKVDGLRLFSRSGVWHFRGWCHLAQDFRTFRCDQIETAELLHETAEVAETGLVEAGLVEAELAELASGEMTYHASPDDPRVVIEISPWATRLAEEYDVEVLSQTPDGKLRIRLAVGRQIFLERLLMQTGGAAVSVAGGSADTEISEDIAQQAANRILSRYEQHN